MRTQYRIDDFQETYFVIDGFEDTLDLARIDFGPVYQRINGEPEFQPSDILPTEELITRGTGVYHQAKKRA